MRMDDQKTAALCYITAQNSASSDNFSDNFLLKFPSSDNFRILRLKLFPSSEISSFAGFTRTTGSVIFS